MSIIRTRARAAIVCAFVLGSTGCDNDSGSGPRFPVPVDGFDPVPGNTVALTNDNRLLTFDRGAMPALRTSATITGLQPSERLLGIDTRPGGQTPGQLYALGSSGRLYTLDLASGVATQRAVLAADTTDITEPFAALAGTEFGVDFNPVVDRLRVVSDTGQNLRINVDTGATLTDGALNIGGTVTPGINAVAYTNAFGAACRTALYYLDAANDRLLTTSDPNNGVLSVVGALGLDADAVNGFEIVTGQDGSNSALVTLVTGGVAHLYTLNLTTGVATDNGALARFPTTPLRGLARADAIVAPTTQAAGEVVALTDTNKLVSFTAGAPQKLCTTATVTGLQANENLLGIDVRPADGVLYGLGSSGRLYTLDRASAAATMKSLLAVDTADMTDPFASLTGTAFGVDFNAVPDRLRVVSNTGQNLRINVDTGVTTTDTALNPAGSTVTEAAYTNAFGGAVTTTLYVIDVANDRLLVQGQPSGSPNNGDLQAVGALGLTADIEAAGGFDINARTNVALAALTTTGATTSDLYTLNLTSGAATRVNTVGGGERVRGLTFSGVAQATVIGITSDQRYITFKPATPATLDLNVALTGLQGGESIVAIDVRPANSRVYALTDAGRLYTIDPTAATLAATLGMSLRADPADMTSPFTALSGTAFGGDFNPTVDRLRIVSDAEQNLRANVDMGTTTTDTNLTAAGGAPVPDVVAAAYTRNFVGTTTTSLYVIDVASGSLLLQNPPNDGVLTSVGPLDPVLTFTKMAGFDIAGGADGLALAVLQPSAASASTLYRINLGTGAATAVGPIGPGGTPLITAATIRLQ